VDLVSAVGSLVAGVVLLRVWKPRSEWRFPYEADQPAIDVAIDKSLTAGRVARAWMPFVLLSLTVLLWGLPTIKPLGTPAVKEWLDSQVSWKPPMTGLHQKVAKGEAVTGHKTPEPKDYENATVDLVPASSTGTAVFVAAVLSGLFLGLSPAA